MTSPVLSVGHTGITVSDLDSSVRFYREILGLPVSEKAHCTGEMFEKVTGVPGADLDVCFVRAPGHVIELLCDRAPGRVSSALRSCDPGFMHLCLKIRDIDGVLMSASRAGFAPVGEVQRVSEGLLAGLRVVYMRDPDGVVIELIEEPKEIALEEFYLASARL